MAQQKKSSKKKSSPRILIAHGVNFDLLGRREPDIYGHQTLKDLERLLRDHVTLRFKNSKTKSRPKLVFFQTNDEAKYLAEITKSYTCAILNPGAWTHTSLALGDRVAGLKLKFVEVHLSDLSKRESFRQHSYISSYALKVISGKGFQGYLDAFDVFVKAGLLPSSS